MIVNYSCFIFQLDRLFFFFALHAPVTITDAHVPPSAVYVFGGSGKISLFTSVGLEPTTSGLDLLLPLYQPRYEA